MNTQQTAEIASPCSLSVQFSFTGRHTRSESRRQDRPAAPFLLPIAFFLLPVACGLLPASPCLAQPHDPQKALAGMLMDAKSTRDTLAALRATDDKDLAPLFIAMTRSGDKDIRMFGVSSLPAMAGKDFTAETAKNAEKDNPLLKSSAVSVPSVVNPLGKEILAALRERLKTDPSLLIRTEALLGLAALKVCTKEDIAEGLKSADENLQCVAARTAIELGWAASANDTLRKLTASRDTVTACVSRIALLSQGNADQLDELKKVFQDKGTSAPILDLLLAQMTEEKCLAGKELAEGIITGDYTWRQKVAAYKTVAATSANGGEVVAKAIVAKKKDDPKSFEYELVCRVNLLQLLASQSDAAAHLAALAKGDDEVAALARLEIARKKITTESTEKGKKETPASASSVPSQGDKSVVNPLEKAALDAAGLGHPVVLDYILTCAREDAKARGKEADCYAPALLMMIAAVPEDITDMKIEHYRAALAATCLADIGGDAALAGLKKCLDGKYTAGVRVTAVGLLKSDNPAIADLARPFLKSPYDELAVDAGLILGRFGDRDAKAVLTDIAAKPDKHAIVLLARANWYLLKIAGKSKEAARELAKEIK